MRLYLDATSKNSVTYTPDWLRVTFTEDGKNLEMCLDIRGDIDFKPNCLSCRCKGELIPWVLRNLDTDEETELYELPEKVVNTAYPEDKLAQIICNAKTYEVGIYPAYEKDFKAAYIDNLTDCNGTIDIYIDPQHHYIKDFEFTTETYL